MASANQMLGYKKKKKKKYRSTWSFERCRELGVDLGMGKGRNADDYDKNTR